MCIQIDACVWSTKMKSLEALIIEEVLARKAVCPIKSMDLVKIA